jgi:hypothetical protein
MSTTKQRRTDQLIDQVNNHPYQSELLQLAREQLTDDQQQFIGSLPTPTPGTGEGEA